MYKKLEVNVELMHKIYSIGSNGAFAGSFTASFVKQDSVRSSHVSPN